MEETLLAYAPGILAVALVVVLRLRKRSREKPAQIAALEEKVAALKERVRELEEAKARANEARRDASLRVELSAQVQRRFGTEPRISPGEDSESGARSWRFRESQPEVQEALERLEQFKAELPLGTPVEESYIAELESIVDRLERATGCNLSRWLGVSEQEGRPGAHAHSQAHRVSPLGTQSRERSLVRLRILSLEAFCNYEMYRPRWRRRFVAPPSKAARLIH